MRSLETTGKTIDDAVAKALVSLGVSQEDVEIEVLDDGNKGIFGIGAREAKVRVTAKEQGPAEKAVSFLQNVMNQMNMNATVVGTETDGTVHVEISGENMGLIIGRRGETLDALSYLTSLVINRGKSDYTRVVLDTENYRAKREQTLIQLAERMANKAIRQHRTVSLEPMNPYERRIIHEALQKFEEVTTFSTGDEPNRKVVISLKKARSYEE